MVKQKLLEYIGQKLSQGYSLGQIRNSLSSTRWKPNDVDEAIRYVLMQEQRSQALVQVHPQYPLQTPESIMPFESKNVVGAWMSTVMLGVAIIFVTLLVLSNTARYVDCRTDIDCFSYAAQACDPASYYSVVATNSPGVNESTFFNVSIVGQDGQNCIIDIRIERYSLTAGPMDMLTPDNNTPEQAYFLAAYTNLTNVLQESLGQTGTCSISMDNLTAILSSWQIGNSSLVSDFVTQNCRGEMFINYIPHFGNAITLYSDAYTSLSVVK
jgi:hypothetical protein